MRTVLSRKRWWISRIYGAYRHVAALLLLGELCLDVYVVYTHKKPNAHTEHWHARKNTWTCEPMRTRVYCFEFMFPVCSGHLFRMWRVWRRNGRTQKLCVFISRSHALAITLARRRRLWQLVGELQTRPTTITHWIEDRRDHGFIYRSHFDRCDATVLRLCGGRCDWRHSVAIYDRRTLNWLEMSDNGWDL